MIMKCDTYQERMSFWLDDQLAQDEIRQIEAHAATCPSCRASLDALHRLNRMLSAAPMVSPVPGFTARFQTRLVSRRRRRRTWAGLLTLTLATLALFVGAIVLLVISGLAVWGNLPVSGLLPQATGLLLDLSKATAASLGLAWLIVSALARGLRHPIFIGYVTATAILIAAWTQIVTRRFFARRPLSVNG
jgi:predicted anti-sigma-YlaC factor YlaD